MPIGWVKRKETHTVVPEVPNVDARVQALIDQPVLQGKKRFTDNIPAGAIGEGLSIQAGPRRLTIKSVEYGKSVGGIIHLLDGAEIAFEYVGPGNSHAKIYHDEDLNYRR